MLEGAGCYAVIIAPLGQPHWHVDFKRVYGYQP